LRSIKAECRSDEHEATGAWSQLGQPRHALEASASGRVSRAPRRAWPSASCSPPAGRASAHRRRPGECTARWSVPRSVVSPAERDPRTRLAHGRDKRAHDLPSSSTVKGVEWSGVARTSLATLEEMEGQRDGAPTPTTAVCCSFGAHLNLSRARARGLRPEDAREHVDAAAGGEAPRFELRTPVQPRGTSSTIHAASGEAAVIITPCPSRTRPGRSLTPCAFDGGSRSTSPTPPPRPFPHLGAGRSRGSIAGSAARLRAGGRGGRRLLDPSGTHLRRRSHDVQRSAHGTIANALRPPGRQPRRSARPRRREVERALVTTLATCATSRVQGSAASWSSPLIAPC